MEEKKSKKKLLILIPILAVLAAGGLIVGLNAKNWFGQGKETEAVESSGTETEPVETVAPTETEEEDEPYEGEQLPIYYNVDLQYYMGMSEGGLSSRLREEDGYYHFLMSVDGKHVTLKTKETRTMNFLDSRPFCCIKADEEGIIEEAYEVEKCNYSTLMEEVYLFNSAKNSLTVNTDEFFAGFTYAVSDKNGFLVYDTSNEADPVPEVTLEKGMKLSIFRYKPSKQSYVYVFPAGIPADQRFYWNVTRKWNSDIQNTTREPNADGIYEIEMANNGQVVTVKVKDRELVYEIDKYNAKCFVLSFDKDGFVSKVQTATAGSGGSSVASWHHVMKFNNDEHTNFHAKKTSPTASDFKHEVDVELAENCQIYCVNNYYDDHYGEATTLRVGDQVHCIKKDGKAILIYVINRQFDSKHYWNVSRKYNSTTKTTTRTPNAAGYYEFVMAVGGKQVTVKTADKALATKIDSVTFCGLKLSGDIVTAVYTSASSSLLGYYGSQASWYDVVSFESKDQRSFKAKRTIEGTDYGKSCLVTMADDCEVFNVSGYYNDHVGEPTTVQLNDRIHACLDENGQAKLIYVVTRFANTKIYWNVTRKYNSTTKETTRTPEKDGFYYFDMACDGKQITVRAKKDIADKMDAVPAKNMGLFLDADGKTVTKFVPSNCVKSASGGSSSSWCDVLTLTANTFSTQKLDDPNSSYYLKKYNETFDSTMKVFNCTNYFENDGKTHFVGEKATLRVGDKVHVLRDKNKKAAYVFIVDRGYPVTAHKDKHTCPDCGQNVEWKPWTKATNLPTAEGHYYLCGDVKLSGGVTTGKNQNVVLCLNGYRVDGPKTNRIYTTGENGKLTIIGTEKGSTLAGHYHGESYAGCVIFSYKADLVMYGGTLDASDVETKDKASAVFTYSGMKMELHDVTIIGGKSGSCGVVSANNGCDLLLDNVTIKCGESGDKHHGLHVAGSALVRIKGDLKFENIPSDGAPIVLLSGAKLTLEGMTGGTNAAVKMETKTGVFTTNYVEGAEAFFTSADPAYVVGYGDGKALELAGSYATSITAPDSITYRQLQHGKIEASVVPADAANRIITFESADPELVSVDNAGNMEAFRKEGTTTVTVKTKDGKAEKQITVTVSGEPVSATGITLNETELSLFLGASNELIPTFAPEEASYLSAIYESSDEKVATVDENGVVTATGIGSAVITVKPERGDCQATCTVTVTSHEHPVCMIPGCTEASAHDDHKSETWKPWTNSTALPTEDGHWYLATDVTVSKETALQGKEIVLDLAGHTVNATSKVFHLTAGASLAITDCQGTGTIRETGTFASNAGSGIFNIRGGSEVVIFGGTIDATGVETGYGPVAYIHTDEDNYFLLYGGTVKGGKGLALGGAIYGGVNSTVVITGGVLEGGSSPKGGAILSYGEVYLLGGTVKGGTADSYGGNIAMDNKESALYIIDGTIEGGSTPSTGGNIYSAGTVSMIGGTVTGGQAKSGGNIYSTNKVGIADGSIENGVAANYGGNITMYGINAELVMVGGQVKDGLVTANAFSAGGNINLTSANFTMSDGLISGGRVENYYGGNIATDGNSVEAVISGGRIENGYAGRDGGNIYAHTNTNKPENHNTVTIGGTAVVTGGEAKESAGNILVDKGATLIVQETAEISDSKAAKYAGNIKLANGADMELKGDAVIKNGQARHSGNVQLDTNSVFTMEGGTIENGTATKVGTDGGFGGNVAVRGTFTMKDGVIKGGKAIGNVGGNVSVWQTESRFIMEGGLITGGETDGSILDGGVTIFYNAKADDAFIMKGGEISGNVGGVRADSGKIQLSGNPVIKDNGTANLNGKAANITLGGALTAGAEIFVSVPTDTLFAESETDYKQYFKSDDAAYEVVYDSVNKGHKLSRDYSDMKLDIYMLAGQSNASGSSSIENGEAAGVRDTNVYNNVRYYYFRKNTDGTVVQNRTTFEAVKEGMGYATGYIGPELGMAEYLDSLYQDADKEALIFKYAAGGTSLIRYTDENGVIQNAPSQTGDSADRYNQRGSWYPESLLPDAVKAMVAADPSNPSGFLSRGLKEEIETLYNKLIAMGYKPENIRFISVSWMQGGEDRTRPEPYPAAFKGFVEEIRAKVSEVTGQDYSKLPFVVGEISETFSSATASNVATNRAFIDMQDTLPGVVSDTYVVPSRNFATNAMVDGTSTAVGTDTAHLSYKDCLALGQLFAEMSFIATNDTSSLHMHCICGDGNMTAGAHGHATLLWKEWTESTSLPTESGNYYLTTDVTVSAQTNLAGKSVNLCLNGHKINSTAKVFHLTAGSTLKITDCKTGGTIKETGTFGNTSGNGIFNTRGGSKVEIYAGTIDASGVTTGYGPIAYVNGDEGDEFSIYGGTLKGGIGISVGGGFWMGANSVFNMHGGVLEGGVGPRGGSIYSMGYFNMTGGTITGGQTAANPNTTDAGLDRMGGNIYFGSSNKTFTMTGGTITKGKTQTLTNGNDLGGNVAIIGLGCTVRITGGEISWGEANSGGNIYLRSSSATKWQDVEFSGGLITDGFAQSVGGNIDIRQYVYFHMTGGSILNGFAKNSNAGQVSVRGGIVRISDGTIGATKTVDGAASKGLPLAMQVDGTSKIAGVFLIEGGSVPGIQATSTGGSLTYGGETYAGGLVKITGGSVLSASIYNGSIEVHGGTVGTISANGNTGATATPGDARIYGGYVKTLTKTNSSKSTIHITGGTFVANPTNWVESGHTVQSGDFTNTEDPTDTTDYKFKVQ